MSKSTIEQFELLQKIHAQLMDQINMVSKRVQQLNAGRAPLIDTVPSMGAADIALKEIIDGKVKLVETAN